MKIVIASARMSSGVGFHSVAMPALCACALAIADASIASMSASDIEVRIGAPS
jgi:hypothetical protein